MKIAGRMIIALSIFVSYSYTQQQTPEQIRLGIATAWLNKLCVLKNGDFRSISQQDLDRAFDTWRKQTTDVAQCDPSVFSNPPEKVAVNVSSLRLNAWERIARVGQFQSDFQQTPDYVYGIIQGQPSTTPSKFYPNPDHTILSLGGPLYLNELYVGADTRVNICAALDPDTEKADRPCNNFRYVTATRLRDDISRIGAAMTLNFNFSQVPKYEAPIIVTSLTSFGYPQWSKNITGSFDPSLLFRTSAEKKALAGYAGKVPVLTRQALLDQLCDGSPNSLTDTHTTAQCIRSVTIGKTPQRLAISLLPRINVKVTSPFDLAKYGSTFVSPPDKAGRSIYDVTLSWDLRNLIPSASSRLDAFNAIKAAAAPAPPPPLNADQIKEARWRRAVAGLYIELQAMPERSLDDQWWSHFESTVLRQ